MGEYKTSLSLQTQVPSVSSVTLGLEGTSDPFEARYWTTKYNLGSTYSSFTPNRFAHAHSLQFKANSNAIVSKVIFGPPTFQKQSPLAVVSGPRVSLYTGPAFARALKEEQQHYYYFSNSRSQCRDGWSSCLVCCLSVRWTIDCHWHDQWQCTHLRCHLACHTVYLFVWTRALGHSYRVVVAKWKTGPEWRQ